jgi:hypothetical protein
MRTPAGLGPTAPDHKSILNQHTANRWIWGNPPKTALPKGQGDAHWGLIVSIGL